MMSVQDPFNGYHEMKFNWAIACQNELEFSDQKVKLDFHSILKILDIKLIFFVPYPLL